MLAKIPLFGAFWAWMADKPLIVWNVSSAVTLGQVFFLQELWSFLKPYYHLAEPIFHKAALLGESLGDVVMEVILHNTA